MAQISSTNYIDLELYHIANSGINGTCKNNPCMNGALCFYTASLNDYFCQCTTCYSGPFCSQEFCNSGEVNLSYFKNLKITRLNQASYYAVAFVFFIFISATWCSIKLYKRFKRNAKQSESRKFEAELYFNDQQSLSANY